MAKKGRKGASKSGGGGKAKKGRKPAARGGKSSKAKKPMAPKATSAKSKPKKSMRGASARKSAGRSKKSTARASSASKAKKPKKSSSSRKTNRGGQATIRITESVTQFISTPQGVVADTIETVSTFPPDSQERQVQTTDDIAAEGQHPSLASEEEMEEEEDEFGEMGEGGASMSDLEEPMSNDNNGHE